LSGDVVETMHSTDTASTRTDRMATLESEVRELRERLESLERQWKEFTS
jgi:polyhydroxyalkanoate synthesis regulator phasin